jgi:hypothetical protein
MELTPNTSPEMAPKAPVYQEKSANTPYQKAKTLSLLGTVAVLILIGTSSYGGYLVYANNKAENQIETVKNSIAEQKNVIKISDNQNVDLKFKNNFLAQKKAAQIYWTNVINNIKRTTDDSNRIAINSIAGNISGNVNVSLTTTENSLEPFADTAKLITRFKTNSFASNTLIPSISTVTTLTGESRLNYTLRFDYKKAENETLAETLEINENAAKSTTTEPNSSSNPEVNQRLIEELQRRTTTTNPTE